jgi:hypothetical protein
VAQTLCTSRNPKASSHKGLNRETVQATDKTSSHHEHPDLTPCDYLLWGYAKDNVFVPPQPVSIPDLKNRIEVAVATITPADQCMAENGLSPRCVPCDEACIHRTFVGMCHKLAELLFHFY